MVHQGAAQSTGSHSPAKSSVPKWFRYRTSSVVLVHVADQTATTALEDVAAHLRATIAPLSRLLRQHSGGHLTPTQSTVLSSIVRHGPISISDLAAREQLSLPVVSKAVSALEDGELVERIKVPEDRRVCRIQVSEHGEEWLGESRARRDSWLAERLASLEPDELAAIDSALQALQRLTDDPP